MVPQQTKFHKLLDILVCPSCRGKLELDFKTREFICRFDKLAYPIRDDIPVMLIQEARKIDHSDLE